MTKESKPSKPIAMTFFASDASVCWKRAEAYAGPKGRVASLPDVIAARIADAANWESSVVWNRYITTTSVEYAGQSRGGIPIIIVAHDIGPIHDAKSLKASFKASKARPTSGDSEIRGGRISHEEFLKLEDGVYGEVSIVPLQAYIHRYQYPFIETLRWTEAERDPLLAARLGPQWEEYLSLHARLAQKFRKDQNLSRRSGWEGQYQDDPVGPIINLEDPSNCSYGYRASHSREEKILDQYGCTGLAPSMALGHLLVATQIMNMGISGVPGFSLVAEFGCHESSNGARFMGIPKGASLHNSVDPNTNRILARHWPDLLIPAKGKVGPIRHLVAFGKSKKTGEVQHFTTSLRDGDGMDTGVCEHPVRSMRRIKGPSTFTTEIVGYYGFFKYGMKEIERLRCCQSGPSLAL